MRTKYLIIGGNLSGKSMALACEREGEEYVVVERRKDVVDAKLHYIHSDVSGKLAFRFRKIDIVVNIHWMDTFFRSATVDMMNAFSISTTRTIFQNSMKWIDGQVKQGYVPEHGMASLSHLMSQGIQRKQITAHIKSMFGNTAVLSNGTVVRFDKVISTIPLPSLLGMLGKKRLAKQFKCEPLSMWVVTYPKKMWEDIYQIIYIPEAEDGISRLSVLGDRIVAEDSVNGSTVDGLKIAIDKVIPLASLKGGKANISRLTNPMGRYIPIEELQRMEIMEGLAGRNIICLGRYSEWTYRRFEHVLDRAFEIASVFKTRKGVV
jgi:hypothetical protein